MSMGRDTHSLFAKGGLSFDRLRVLLDVRDAGSIAKAAGGNAVRQSQYSRQLKELEECFGVELTIRQGRQLKLTAAGEELAALTREHFTWLGDFAAKVSGTASLYAIGAGESLIDWLLLPRLSSLSASLPGVSLRLDNLRGSEIVERLQDRVLDFGVLNADRIPAGFDRKSLGQLRYRLAVPSGLLAKDGAIPAIAELPLAVMTPDSNIGRVCLEALGHGVRPLQVRLQCDSFPAIARAVQSGAYVGILPDIAAADPILQGVTFREIKALNKLASSYSLVWIARRLALRPRFDAVRRWLATELAPFAIKKP
jgi:DNA-binding transcriptional LysR family regulator